MKRKTQDAYQRPQAVELARRLAEPCRLTGGHWGAAGGQDHAGGAHLANAAQRGDCELFYWREKNREVDFVVRAGKRLLAIEVKSGRRRDALPGMAAFSDAFRPDRTLLVGGDGIALETFLSRPVMEWLNP